MRRVDNKLRLYKLFIYVLDGVHIVFFLKDTILFNMKIIDPVELFFLFFVTKKYPFQNKFIYTKNNVTNICFIFLFLQKNNVYHSVSAVAVKFMTNIFFVQHQILNGMRHVLNARNVGNFQMRVARVLYAMAKHIAKEIM